MNVQLKHRHKADCCCPACRGLEAFQRPLFAPNQLLRASDLNQIQAYLKAKNRLHNRHLHGSGVVCGLEVLCDDCVGSVRVTPGYAIDPCGEDIVLPDGARFDVIKAIDDCLTWRRDKLGDCDPWQPPRDPACDEAETHWCLWIRYRETEAAHTRGFENAPRPGGECGCGGASGTSRSGGCGCGGGGTSGGCGCGGGSHAAKAAPKAGRATAVQVSGCEVAPGCEPRRILEGYEIGIMESKEGCGTNPFRPIRRTDGYERQPDAHPLGGWGKLIPDGSLLGRLVDCLVELMVKPYRSWPQAEMTALFDFFAPNQPPQANAIQMQAALARFRREVMTALADDPHPVRCQLRNAAGAIVLPQFDEGQDADSYRKVGQIAFDELRAVLVQLVLDCLCHVILPPCPPEACDDRIELACIVVRNRKIQRICNTSCRTYAGSFPAVNYWLSAVPVLPMLMQFVSFICCQPDLLRRNSPLVNDLPSLLQKLDPDGALQARLFSDEFAMPRRILAGLQIFGPADAAGEAFARARASLAGAQPEADATVSVKPSAKAKGADAVEARLAAMEAELAVLRQAVGGALTKRPVPKTTVSKMTASKKSGPK